MKTHYIGTAGLYGCMPSFCEVYETRKDAAQSLGDIHELEGEEIDVLIEDSFINLSLRVHGNEYAEIGSCTCEEPWVHSETSGPLDWPEYIQHKFTYHVNLDERGQFYADVRDFEENTVYEIHGFDIFEHGFMRHKEDIDGLANYLRALEVIPADGEIA